MKSRRLIAAVLLALVAALMLALPASPDTPAAEVTTGGNDPLATFRATLTGEKEVPGPGDPDGSGSALVEVFQRKVCYELTVRRIAPATAAHIHLGFRDEAGPVVATLKPPTDGSSAACVEVPRALSLELRQHHGRYYINVHNEPYPGGAVRGQLFKA